MIYGASAIYGPAVLLWIPSYYSADILAWYRMALQFGNKMIYINHITVITMLITDIMLTWNTTELRKENDLVALMLYVEFQTLLHWSIPHFKLDEGA